MILLDTATESSGYDVTDLLTYCGNLLKNVLVFHVGSYTYSLWDVFVAGTILCLLGWMLGKFLNPWSIEKGD